MSSSPEQPNDGPRVYRKQQIMKLLSIGGTTYHKLIKPDARGRALLNSSRLYPGGPRVHTEEQLREFLKELEKGFNEHAASRRLRKVS